MKIVFVKSVNPSLQRYSKKILKSHEPKRTANACAKQMLSDKIIFAHILKGTVEEFKEMKPTEIVSLIEGGYVSEVPIEPGETN